MTALDVARDIYSRLPELTEDEAEYLILQIGSAHGFKTAIMSKTKVQEEYEFTVTDEDWERIEKTYEWRNLTSYMYEGATNAIEFARKEDGI